MTVPADHTSDQWNGTGAQTVFPYTFMIFDEGDLAVYLVDNATKAATLQTLSTHYTVDGVGDETGGNVTFVTAPASGYVVDIRSNVPRTQLSAFTNLGRYLPETHERTADRLARQIQDVARSVGQCLRLPDTFDPDATLSPWPRATRKGKYGFYFNATTGAAELFESIGATTLSQSVIGGHLWPQTAAELAAGVTPSNYAYPEGDLRRYGAVGNSNGTAGNGTPDTSAVTAAVSANLGRFIFGGGKSYRVGATLPSPSVPAGAHLVNGEFVSDQMVTAQDEYSVTVLGWKALQVNTYIPEQHAASGGRFFASGNHLVAVGREAMKANTTGRRNTAVGSRALLANTTGYYNSGLGSHTLEVCTVGYENTAVGVQSLQAVANGFGNTGVGVGAGLGVSSGTYNTGVGYGAAGGANGTGQTTGSYNTGVGYRAAYSITTCTDVTAVGRDALVSLTEGTGNTAVGATALTSVVTGTNNTAVGTEALRNTTGSQHVAVGVEALKTIVGGLGGTAVGYQAGRLVTGNYLTAVGYQALSAVSSGANNTALGRAAGATVTTGSNNVCIGYSADVSAAGASNQNSIGYSAACTGDNQVTLGNASIATLRCQQTSITALSDARDKTDIVGVPLGLEFIESVRPVRFTWNMRDGSKVGVPEAGFIAQELKAAQDAVGADWLGLVDASNPDRLEAAPGKLLPILVKAVQELSARVRELEARSA